MNYRPAYLLVLVSILSLQISAQGELTIRYGFKGGLNVSNTSTGVGSGPSYKDPKAKMGFAAGAFVNIPLSDRFSLQPELLYSKEGSKQDGLPPSASSSNYTQLFEMNLNYIILPVMVQLNDEESGLYIEAGPQLSWLATSKLASSIDVSNILPLEPFKAYFNSRVLSASLGAGINLLNGIGIGARYNFGITPVTEDIGIMKSNALFIGAHFKF